MDHFKVIQQKAEKILLGIYRCNWNIKPDDLIFSNKRIFLQNKIKLVIFSVLFATKRDDIKLETKYNLPLKLNCF